MPAKKKQPEGPQLTKLQKFHVERVKRSDINTAAYNPRRISEAARKQLHGNLQSRGLLETLVVNRLTMNLVSGHQRLSKIDKSEGYPGRDYLIDVAMIELTDQEEKEQNIFFNAKGTQGEFDTTRLMELLPQIDAAAAGLSQMDLALIQGAPASIEADDLSDLFRKKDRRQDPDGDEGELQQQTNEIKGKKAAIREGAGNKAADTLLAYLTINFQTMADKAAFMERFALDPYLTFIDGEEFGEMCEAVIDHE